MKWLRRPRKIDRTSLQAADCQLRLFQNRNHGLRRGASAWALVEAEAPQAERVGDDADGRQRHGETGDHRLSRMPKNGKSKPAPIGMPGGIVDESEEEVLANAAHHREAKAAIARRIGVRGPGIARGETRILVPPATQVLRQDGHRPSLGNPTRERDDFQLRLAPRARDDFDGRELAVILGL